MASQAESLGLYAEGWTQGDVDKVMAAIAPTFTFDDPQVGLVSKQDFPEYFRKIRALRSEQPFMLLTEVITQEGLDALTAWCWWEIPSVVQGSGLIKVTDQGVVSEQIAYYTKLA